MGDPFSTSAGVLAVAGVGINVVKLAKGLYEDYQEAPRLAKHVLSQHDLLRANIKTTGKSRSRHSASLTVARSSLEAIESNFPHISSDSPKGRLRWALRDKREFKGVQDELRDVESSTILALQLEQLEYQADIRERDDKIALLGAMVSNFENEMRRHKGQQPMHIVHLGQSQTATPYPSPDVVIQQFNMRLSKLLGIEACIIISKPEGATKYDINFRWTLASNVFSGRVEGFWGPWLPLISFSLLHWQHVVPEESEIMTACKTGDVETMMKLFSSGQASPYDVTPDKLTLLYFAISSGNPNAVQLLLDMGSDPNLSYDCWNTSPLNSAFFYGNVDIVRKLLMAKADLHYVNTRMWTSARYLYDSHLSNLHTMEMLDICACERFEQWDSLDRVGWTVLHRAAAFGRAKDIKKLINLGASPEVYTYDLRWLPIHCAIQHGNEETFDFFAANISREILIQLTDLQGWTLLHIACENGSEALMTNLLLRGLDVWARSDPSSLCVPAGLENQELTPMDIARFYGHEETLGRAMKAASQYFQK